MNYETVVAITQSLALVFFVLLFLGVVAYAFWPGNKKKFENASRLPFDSGGTPHQERKK